MQVLVRGESDMQRRIPRCRLYIIHPPQTITRHVSKAFSTTSRNSLAQIQILDDWNLTNFRERAFTPACPAKLPRSKQYLPAACTKWFVSQNNNGTTSESLIDHESTTTELRTSFWSAHSSTLVPLELTTSTSEFHRTQAPLQLLLTYLGHRSSTHPSQTLDDTNTHTNATTSSIYLAQCDLTTLPDNLRSDVPTPSLVLDSGRGDIYSSSLWMGRPPTYTPLHRDPNPNLFLQLAGRKVVRLFPPKIGDAVFDEVQERLAMRLERSSSASASFRGDEMMRGPERELLEKIVWCGGHDDIHNNNNDSDDSQVLSYATEACLGPGEALFIPKGWWHSVRGVGHGITASVNWWFR